MTDTPDQAQADTTTQPDPTAEPATNLPAPQRKKAELVASEGLGYIVPRTIEEAYRYAVAVVDAGLAPDSYKESYSDKWANPQKVMLGITAAMEAGLPPLFGLRQIAIINGRPTIWGDAAMALVQSKNLIADQEKRTIGHSFDHSGPVNEWPDEYGYVVSLWRRGQTKPYVGEFTVGMAKRAGLWLNTKKKPWIEHPDRMLYIRARAFPLRDGFADALAGLAIREEIEDMNVDDKKPVNTSFLDGPGEEENADPQAGA